MLTKIIDGKSLRGTLDSMSGKMRDMLIYSINHGILIYITGFLLGKALILNDLAPFSIAFFAVMLIRRPEIAKVLAIMIGIGSLTIGLQHAIYTSMSVVLLLSCYNYFEKREKIDISMIPYQVLLVTFISKIGILYWINEISSYSLVLAGLESSLALLLTLIFTQAVPIIFGRLAPRILRNEEIICAFILVASILIGTGNWVWYGVHVDQILGGLVIILLAHAGGAGIGAAVGVVIGLIMSLANPILITQMATLAFTGLLAGLLREGKKVFVMVGFFIGYIALTIYMRPDIELLPVFVEVFSIFFLFSITPKSVTNYIMGLIPGTAINMWNQIEYKNKVKELVAGKVNRYGRMLDELASTFTLRKTKREQESDFHRFVQHAADTGCRACHRHQKCWGDESYRTYQGFSDMFISFELGNMISPQTMPQEIGSKCIDKKRLIDVLHQEFQVFRKEYYWKGQVEECRGLLSEQLRGISNVMEQLSSEIVKDGLGFSKQEVEISRAMESLGLAIQSTQIINLDKGQIEIHVTKNGCRQRDECVKVLAPMIADIVGENISIRDKKGCNCENGDCSIVLASAPVYDVEYGFVSIGKGGTFISGDSYEGVDLGNGKYVLAISDGMGNGQRAREESQAAIKLLKTLLQAGLSEDTAIKTVNAALMLRSTEEMFATLDLAFINLFTGETKFMKVGSSPSFVKSQATVDMITSRSLPVGILQEIQYSLEKKVLKQGDIIVMLSDGILDSIKHVNNREEWLQRIIGQISCDDPQEIADVIVEKVLRFNNHEVTDDTTILVAKVMPYQAQWAAIPVPGIKKLATA